MRIERIVLRNYRGVAEHEVELGNGVTVVEGANEVGKSSLAEAVDLLIHYRADSNDARVRAVRPTHSDVAPEVEADLAAGPFRFTYAKRWAAGHNAQTVLNITEPAVDVLRGREAHDRAMEILQEHADLTLWAALRVLQVPAARPGGPRTALDQPDLTGHNALKDALDTAAGHAVADQGANSLIALARGEYERYFTKRQGAPGVEYKQVKGRYMAAEAEVRLREATLDRVGNDVAEYRRIDRDLADLRERAREAAPVILGLEVRHRELESAAQRIAVLESEARAKRAEADAAQAVAEARRELCAQAESATVEAERRAEVAERVDGEREGRREVADAAAQDAATAREAEDAARTAAERAEADHDHLRTANDLAELVRRRDRAADAARRIEQCAADLATLRITQDGLEKLEKHYDKLRKAQAALESASSLVEITAVDSLRALALDVNGRTEPMAVGGAYTRYLTDETTLTVDEFVRIRIVPGVGERAQRTKVNQLQQDFIELCKASGVTDLDDARAAEGRRRDLDQVQKTARTETEAVLGEERLEDVAVRIAELGARTSQYRAGIEGRTLPASLADAQAAMADAHDLLKQRGAWAEQSAVVAKTQREAADKAQTSAVLAQQRAEDAQETVLHLAAKLVEVQVKETDEDLADRCSRTVNAAESADKTWRAAAADFDATELDSTAALLESRREAIKRRDDDITRCNLRLVELRTRLDNDHAASERLDEAVAALDDARRHRDDFERRAVAARLLYDTLEIKRKEAQRAYVEPFRRKLEQYARIVFDEQLELVVDDDLTVTHRILKGAKVPYESLSGGAREQLALCSRLACAALVDETDGVPVVIDDALGYTDPERLERISAVVGLAGRSCQILILTCMSDRYREINGATVVRLQRNPLPTGALPAPRHEADDASDSVQVAPTRSAREAVLAVLREAAGPLGRSDLVESAGIPAGEWTPVIKALVEEGRVRQQGERRGAKYVLGDTLD